MRRQLAAVSLLALALLGASSCGKKESAAQAPAGARAQIDHAALFDSTVEDLTRDYFRHYPEQATYYGAPASLAGEDADSRLNDRSTSGDAATRAMLQASLDRVRGVDAAALDPSRAARRDVLIAQYESMLAPTHAAAYGAVGAVYGSWFSPYAVIQNAGPIVDVPNLMQAQQKVTNAAEAEAWLKRLSAFAATIDASREKIAADAKLGVTAPDFIITKIKNVVAASTAAEPAKNAMVADFAKKLRDADVTGADAYAARAARIMADDVYPAQKRLLAELEAQAKTATHDAGVWRLPNGEALYAAMIRQMTDTTMSADAIHDTGLKEVARISAEMDAILKANGYKDGTVGARMTKLGEEARFFYPNTDAGKAKILKDIGGQIARVNAAVPSWFGVQPRHALEVRAVPAFSQDSAPGGYYDAPALDGSRPGIYWINLRDTAIWPKYTVPTLTYHEAVPGHHLQGAIALDLDAPLLLNILYSNAYGEGWALYAEALAKEMGLYDGDPYGDLGRLQDELHRAVRLVVDTGMHAKKWSREQAIDYVVAVEGAHPKEAESEVERYVVWPGQALGYKIGMLRIQALRARAKSALGVKFDIKAFHDVVLTGGPVPLSILEKRVDSWIAEEKAKG